MASWSDGAAICEAWPKTALEVRGPTDVGKVSSLRSQERLMTITIFTSTMRRKIKVATVIAAAALSTDWFSMNSAVAFTGDNGGGDGASGGGEGGGGLGGDGGEESDGNSGLGSDDDVDGLGSGELGDGGDSGGKGDGGGGGEGGSSIVEAVRHYGLIHPKECQRQGPRPQSLLGARKARV